MDLNICGGVQVVLKGNSLSLLTMIKQLPFLFMQQQFKSLHLLRKFTAVVTSPPVTTLGPFPLVLEYNAKECCQCLLTTARFFRYMDTGGALLIKKCYTC